MVVYKLKHKHIVENEKGVVSLIVSFFIVLIISLVVLSFAKIMQREQRQAIDRQLSTQAYYAAEAGINDAVKALSGGYNNDKLTCAPDSSGLLSGTNVIDSSGQVSYPCLLLDLSPKTVEYSSVNATQSISVPLRAALSFDHVLISWQAPDGTTNFSSSAPNLPSSTGWTASPGVLRVTLTPMAGGLSRDGLIQDAYTVFLYPQAGNGSVQSVTYTTNQSQKGPIVGGACNATATPRHCNVQISGLSAVNKNSYFIQIRSLYANSTVTVTGYDSSGSAQRLRDAQAMIDSTGKATDVLRRIQVRVPLRNSYNYPDFAVESAFSICKRLGTTPTGAGEYIEASPDAAGCAE